MQGLPLSHPSLFLSPPSLSPSRSLFLSPPSLFLSLAPGLGVMAYLSLKDRTLGADGGCRSILPAAAFWLSVWTRHKSTLHSENHGHLHSCTHTHTQTHTHTHTHRANHSGAVHTHTHTHKLTGQTIVEQYTHHSQGKP